MLIKKLWKLFTYFKVVKNSFFICGHAWIYELCAYISGILLREKENSSSMIVLINETNEIKMCGLVLLTGKL